MPNKVKTLLEKKKPTKGEKTKEKILLAAIEILAEKGIKGTTHRAIAQRAELQLSLTTYYFKDIQELIQQAFQLNSNYLTARTNGILDKAFSFLNKTNKTDLENNSIKNELCNQLVEMTVLYLFENIKKEAIPLSVEQLMFTTVQISPQLKKLANEHEQAQLQPFEQLCQHFNDKDPDIDAIMMRTIFSQLQYSQLLIPQDEISIEPIKKIVRKMITWIMGINPS